MENYMLLIAAILCGICTILTLSKSNIKSVKKAIIIVWALSVSMVILAVALLISYLISSDFNYQYVYSHSSSDTFILYKISALWAGQEGSFLLWAFIQGIMGFYVLSLKGAQANISFRIYSLICTCIFIMSYITKPFAKMSFISNDGLGLNAALKDPWMIIHPPLVFLSYSTMAILFSLLPYLYQNKSSIPNKLIKLWTRISLFFLGLGILSGSIWAYRALGWGGYWAWDPIENAALVPWLILTSFLHKEKTTKFDCILPFSTACIGVFFARSGILKNQSAHAYTAGNMAISLILLCFIISIIIYLVFHMIQTKKMTEMNLRTKHWPGTVNNLIIYFINSYAILIFAGTIVPIISHIDTPMSYFNILSIGFAILYTILLLVRSYNFVKRYNILMMALSTLTTTIIMLLPVTIISFWWLILIWFVSLPLSLWIVCRFKTDHLRYYFAHAGMILLIIGAITSSALGKTYYAYVNQNNDTVEIYGTTYTISKSIDGNLQIKSSPSGDILLQNSNIISLPEGGYMLPYTTKPLIILFWTGCFLILFNPCIIFIFDRLYQVIK